MKNLTFIITAILCMGSGFAQDNDTSYQNKLIEIDKQLNTVLERSKAAGFAIAIVKGDEVLYSKGFGYRDLENQLPVTANTVFPIGSTSKAFTASLIGILEEEGKVDLNESPRIYIPELEFYNAEMNDQIKVKDLMTHSTGLPRHDASWRNFAHDSTEELLSQIAFQEPSSPVRSKWIYNNFMYMLLGVITERITEQSWGQIIDQKLFKQLGMTNSNTSIEALKKNAEAAVGYYFDEGVNTKIDYFDIAAVEAAGGINSSANDMSKWMMVWLNNGVFNGKQVLPSAYVKAAMSSQMIVTGKFPSEIDPNTFMNNYGYGWFVKSYKGHYRVDHGGGIDGFTAEISLFPTDDLGIVILTNQNQSGLPQTVRNMVADILLDTPETRDWMAFLEKYAEQQAKVQEVKPIISITPVHSLEQYSGTYVHKGYGIFDVTVKNDSLFAEFPLKTLWLNPIHPSVFETYTVVENKVETNSQEESIKFIADFEGEILGLEMVLERRLDPIVFTRASLIKS